MKRLFREVEAIWRRTLHRRSQKAGMFMPRFLRLLRRFPLSEPTILNPYRTVIQELTKCRHESRGSPGVKLCLFAGIGKEPHFPHGSPSAFKGWESLEEDKERLCGDPSHQHESASR
jgi:hypothetical protein